jgi:K+-transporting ATPase ATPase C chain
MLTHLRPALTLLVAFTLITGLAYPLAMTGLTQALFPAQAAGSLVTRNGQVIGSSLMGQSFASDRYFHGRLSATTAADPADSAKTIAAPYNAASTAGSNYGPTSKALNERMSADVAALKAENPAAAVPTELVTASGSGLDPDVSPQAALFQVPRIARARGLPEERLKALVNELTEGRTFGVLGEPRVNVLAINLALDAMKP